MHEKPKRRWRAFSLWAILAILVPAVITVLLIRNPSPLYVTLILMAWVTGIGLVMRPADFSREKMINGSLPYLLLGAGGYGLLATLMTGYASTFKTVPQAPDWLLLMFFGSLTFIFFGLLLLLMRRY